MTAIAVDPTSMIGEDVFNEGEQEVALTARVEADVISRARDMRSAPML